MVDIYQDTLVNISTFHVILNSNKLPFRMEGESVGEGFILI